MARYIDADKLIKFLNSEIEYRNSINKKLHNDGICYAVAAYYDMKRQLEENNIEDVQPVVHGKWDICSNGYYPYCSVCRCEPENGKMTKYCPNCGARMDGDDNG